MSRAPYPGGLRPILIPVASFAALGVFWGAWAALVPEVKRQTGASEPELGAALLWMGAGALPAMLVTGRLWRRFGRRLVTATLLVYGVVAIGPALAPNPLFLAAAMALVGAASGSLDVAMNAAVSDIEVTTGRRLMYVAHGLFSLAVLVASVSVGILRGLGITPVAVLGTVGLLFLALTALAAATDRGVPITRQPEHPPGAPGRRIPKGVAVLGVLIGAAYLIEDAMVSWSAIHIEEGLGASPVLGGAGPGIFAAAMFIGRLAGQTLGKRWSERSILVGSGILAAVGVLVVAVAPVAAVVLVGLAVAGAGISVAAPALIGRAGRLAGAASRGAAVSMLTTFGYVGFILGPPLVGFVAGATDLRVAFVGLALLALLLSAVAWAMLREAPDAHAAGAGGVAPLTEPPITRA